MNLHGKSILAGIPTTSAGACFQPLSPLNGTPLDPPFQNATQSEVDVALRAADSAFEFFKTTHAEKRAAFLEAIAENILGLGQPLLERAHQETGLPLDRLAGERGRTVGQLHLFAGLVREGSWCDVRIDHALPDRQPLPRPDIRRMLVPIGPVVVFGASNFPLAFSVAGGDTASALAAGCPVVAKGHPAHPGTCEMVANAIAHAATKHDLPRGVFSLLQGCDHSVGMALVEHPLTSAGGFTGSHSGGRALFDAANRRLVPIPFFAEMSSLNPVFLFPNALEERAIAIADGLKTSMTLGVGQFCTKPGLIFAPQSPALERFAKRLTEGVQSTAPGTLLHSGIRNAFETGIQQLSSLPGVRLLAKAVQSPKSEATQAASHVFMVDLATFASTPALHEEQFGPVTLIVTTEAPSEFLKAATLLEGQLTATLQLSGADEEHAAPLLALLERKAGRLLINGFPTGVEVCAAMHHGGPYPASSDSRFTSVGTASIQRWARAVCYQNFPTVLLPADLQDGNPRGLMRLVNGHLTR